jgi:ABC-type antimicrobial peptide transport system permease subunit
MIRAGDPTKGALPVFFFPPDDLVMGIVVAILLGIVTGLLPGIQAMRLKTVEALRRE